MLNNDAPLFGKGRVTDGPIPVPKQEFPCHIKHKIDRDHGEGVGNPDPRKADQKIKLSLRKSPGDQPGQSQQIGLNGDQRGERPEDCHGNAACRIFRRMRTSFQRDDETKINKPQQASKEGTTSCFLH